KAGGWQQRGADAAGEAADEAVARPAAIRASFDGAIMVWDIRLALMQLGGVF
ncbi:hypothetical protein THAOC_14176, partial [Thalassiosira oceanica]